MNQPRRAPRRFFSVPLWLILFLPGTARADLPLIRLDRILPLGGAVGSEVIVDIAGKDLEEVKSLHFDHPGLKAELLKPTQFKVTIAADTPLGTHDVRAVGLYGISGARLFAVSKGLTELRETEPNDSPDKAQAVPVNCVINGTSDGNGDDFFRFPARKGERITLDCFAFRLDSTLRASLVLSSVDGVTIAQSKPYYTRTDPLLDFIAPADGDYIVRLHDAIFNGGLPYRLVISNRPHVESVFPMAAQPGEHVELTILGRNLPGGKTAPEQAIQGLLLEQLTIPLTASKDAAVLQRFDFIQHPPSPCLTTRGLQFFPALASAQGGVLNTATILHADAPVTREREPNDSPETAQEITLPTVIGGRLDKPGDADWYTFTAKAGENIAVELWCERLDLPGDLFIIVTDEKGNERASFDDHGTNFNSLTQFNRDPVGTFAAPTAGKYRLLVQDRYRNGGPRFQYVLRVGKPMPDIYPAVFHATTPDPSCPAVRQGGSAHYEVCLNRWAGFNGPVTITAEGLPAGVSCPPVHVSPQSQFANVVFTAAADAPDWSGAIRLKATGTMARQSPETDIKLERDVRSSQRRWPIDNINTSRMTREICLAVRSKAPYGLKTATESITVQAGNAFDAKVTIDRIWPDFKGKVQITGLNLPPGFSVPTTDLPADKNDAVVKIAVANNVPPGTYTVNLRGDGQVPFNKDAKAASKPNTRVADPATPLTVIVTAAAKK